MLYCTCENHILIIIIIIGHLFIYFITSTPACAHHHFALIPLINRWVFLQPLVSFIIVFFQYNSILLILNTHNSRNAPKLSIHIIYFSYFTFSGVETIVITFSFLGSSHNLFKASLSVNIYFWKV